MSLELCDIYVPVTCHEYDKQVAALPTYQKPSAKLTVMNREIKLNLLLNKYCSGNYIMITMMVFESKANVLNYLFNILRRWRVSIHRTLITIAG